jgi:CheY-like chemotaxis protein
MPPKPSDENPSRLLIIEDMVIHSSIIGLIAAKVGFTIMSARSYPHACELLQMWQFDCITLDLGLGQHTGLEVLNRLADMECKAPIIIISSSESGICDETVQFGKSLDLNIYESVPKPIDLKTLRETLAEVHALSNVRKAAPASA